jgi:ABC-2 type transport system ATP-binding protein
MEPVISVVNLVQHRGKKPVLGGVSFEVAAGERFGVFGAGGAGKTTLLHSVAGIEQIRSGTVIVLGCDVRRSEAFKKDTGLVTEERSLFLDLNAAENLDFFSILKNAPGESAGRLCQRLELGAYLGIRADELDGGVFQRLSLACALLGGPRLLILDDPIRDIDLESRQILINELNRYSSAGGACIWSFSDIGCRRLVDRVGWLANGAMNIYLPDQAIQEWERWRQQVETGGGVGRS